MEKLIEVKNISKNYGETAALADVSFSLPEKGFVFVTGISGSGKTTLLNLMAGLARPNFGKILYAGRDIAEFSELELSSYRNVEIGIVFQNYNLIESMTVEENLRLTSILQKTTNQERTAERINEVLSYVGLEGYSERLSFELSAGQRQRVAIARAIMKNPKVIFADEATGNLDSKTSEQILRLFQRISEHFLVILVSHDKYAAKRYADRILTLSDGKLICDVDNTSIKEAYSKPYVVRCSLGDDEESLPLSEFDLVSLAAKNMEKTTEAIHFKGDIFLKERMGESDVDLTEPAAHSLPKRLSLGNLMFLYNRGTKKYMVRNTALLVLLAFIVYLLNIVWTLTKNDYNTALTSYVDKNKESFFSVELRKPLETGEIIHIRNGEKYRSLIETIFTDGYILEEVPLETLYRDDQAIFLKAYVYDNKIFNTELVSGTLPSEWNELVVSSEAAETFGLGIGTILRSVNSDYKVVGIYDGNGLPESEYLIVASDFGQNHLLSEPSLWSVGADIMSAMSIQTFTSNGALLGRLSMIFSDDLIWGHMPGMPNELIVSNKYLEEHGYSIDSAFPENLRLPDLYSEEYDNRFCTKLNLFDFLGKKVSIVGVYKCSEEDEQEYPDILLSDSVYDDVCRYIGKNLYSIDLHIQFESKAQSIILKMAENNVRLIDDEISIVYQLADEIEVHKKMVRTIEIVAILMVFLITLLCVGFYVRSDSKNIGIYKALGMQAGDLIKLYLLRVLWVGLVALLLANCATWLTVKGINRWLAGICEKPWLTIFHIGLNNTIMLNAFVVLMMIIMTYIPLRILMRRETVRLLNEG